MLSVFVYQIKLKGIFWINIMNSRAFFNMLTAASALFLDFPNITCVAPGYHMVLIPHWDSTAWKTTLRSCLH